MGIRAQLRRRGVRLSASLAVVTIFCAANLPATLTRSPDGPIAGESTPVAADDDLSVLTYNVQGLPWPIGRGRQAALWKIGDRLAHLRAQGRQPHVVVLQEAFTAAAKRIGAQSGYRHIVAGPDAPGDDAIDPPSDAFMQAGRSYLGEGVGAMVDSGLQILSDYPVLSVRREPFTAAACAGFDCLASKGMLLVVVQPPGAATPIAIVDTHLNARKASGVDPVRSLEAYRRQIVALERFVATNSPPGIPVIVAGDLNVGKSPERRALIRVAATRWLGGTSGAVGGVLDDLVRRLAACDVTPPADAMAAHARNKDWQIAIARRDHAIVPERVSVPFGREADGSLLSDHIGYTIHYRITAAPRNRPAAARISDCGRRLT